MSVVRRTIRHALVATVAGGTGVVAGCSNGSEAAAGDSTPSVQTGAGHAGALATGGGNGASTGGGTPAGGAGASAVAAAGGAGGSSSGAGGSSSTAGGAHDQPPAGGGGGSSGASAMAAGRGGFGGGASAGAGAGAGGSSLNAPGCPGSLTAALAGGDQRACATSGMSCAVPVACNSGSTSLIVTCENGEWEGPRGCDKPYDLCLDPTGGTGGLLAADYCDGDQWAVDVGITDFGPTPCPLEPPDDGAPCDVLGGTESGGDRQHCGYPCADPTQWTVISCVASGANGAWTSDGACD